MNQYTNGTIVLSSENYLEKINNKYNLYSKTNNKWNKSIINNTTSKIKFNIKYSNLINKISNYNYLGKEKINGKTLNKYSININSCDAYNFLYSSNIMNKKDMQGKSNMYLYIDKKNNIIYRVKYKIKNVENNNIKMDYNIIIDNVFSKEVQVKIPNN